MEKYLRELKTYIDTKVIEVDERCNKSWDFKERRTLRKIASMLDDVIIEINNNVPQE